MDYAVDTSNSTVPLMTFTASPNVVAVDPCKTKTDDQYQSLFTLMFFSSAIALIFSVFLLVIDWSSNGGILNTSGGQVQVMMQEFMNHQLKVGRLFTTDIYKRAIEQQWFIEHKSITLQEPIGAGSYGEVFKVNFFSLFHYFIDR
jgi:hypothetical protein